MRKDTSAVGVFSERSEAGHQAGLPSWEPQSQEQQPIQHPARKGGGVSICQGEKEKATCLKNKPEHRIFMCSHSSEAPVEGGWCGLE